MRKQTLFIEIINEILFAIILLLLFVALFYAAMRAIEIEADYDDLNYAQFIGEGQ